MELLNSRKMRRTLATLAAGTAAVLALTACGGGGSDGDSGGSLPGKPVADGTLTMGLSTEPAHLYAGKDSGNVGYMMYALLHRGLMAYDNEGTLVEGLAESYEQVDPTTYEFKLRPDLQFSDGSDLTSEDVAKTLEYLANPDSAAHVFAGVKGIESIDTPDAQTAVVHLSNPNNAFLQYLAAPTAGILPQESLSDEVDAWIGAGPFVLEEHNSGTEMVLKRNDSFYAADEVGLETLNLVFYPDGAARTNALLSGDVDLIDYVPWEDFDRVKSLPGITLDAQDGPFMYLHFNVTDGPMADPKVRQAVAHAVNRENAVVAGFSGHGSPLYGMPIQSDDPNYDAAWETMWEYDPEKSKALLAEAGYDDGLKLSLLTSAQYAFHQDTGLSVQADLEAVGIDVELKNPDWPTRVEEGNAGNYDIAVSGNVGIVTDLSYILSFVDGPANYTRSFGYSNPELNAALTEGVQAIDAAEQKAAYDRARGIMIDDVPLTSVNSRAQGFAYTENVGGFKNLPGFLTFYAGYGLINMYEVD